MYDLMPVQDTERTFFLLLFIPTFLALFVIYSYQQSLEQVFAVVVLISVCYGIFVSQRNSLILLFLYLGVVPTHFWGSNYPYFFKGIYFNSSVIVASLGLLLFWEFLMPQQFFAKSAINIGRILKINPWVLIFYFYMLLNAFRGSYRNGNTNAILSVVFIVSGFLFYYFYMRMSEKDINVLLISILFISTIVSFEYIMLFRSVASMSSALLTRVTTQQPHLAQAAVPILLAIALYSPKSYVKVITLTSIIPSLIMAFLSQQRGLWGSLVISIMLVIVMWSYHKKRLLRLFFYMTIGILLVLGLLYIFRDTLGLSAYLTLYSRFSSIFDKHDLSAVIRISEIIRALNLWCCNWVTIFFGTGLGDTFRSIAFDRTTTGTVDCAYIYILWKTGILGLGLFLVFNTLPILRTMKILNRNSNNVNFAVVIGSCCGLLGLYIIAFTNTCIIRYRFVVIWALLYAIIDYYYVKSIESANR